MGGLVLFVDDGVIAFLVEKFPHHVEILGVVVDHGDFRLCYGYRLSLELLSQNIVIASTSGATTDVVRLRKAVDWPNDFAGSSHGFSRLSDDSGAL